MWGHIRLLFDFGQIQPLTDEARARGRSGWANEINTSLHSVLLENVLSCGITANWLTVIISNYFVYYNIFFHRKYYWNLNHQSSKEATAKFCLSDCTMIHHIREQTSSTQNHLVSHIHTMWWRCQPELKLELMLVHFSNRKIVSGLWYLYLWNSAKPDVERFHSIYSIV